MSPQFCIGELCLKNQWLLAPMSGVSEMPFRAIVRQMGAAAAPTELISAKGLIYAGKRSLEYLRHSSADEPFWVQLFGGEPDVLAEAAYIAAEHGARIIDVNMGCPVPKVVKTGAGVALMRDGPRAAAIVAAIIARTGLPVTAKMRSGWDGNSVNALPLAQKLCDVGCAAITIHPRTKAQGYSGVADWSLIAKLAQALPVPVIGNGDVKTPAAAHQMLNETGCAAVMIGRGAMGNPWIFYQLSSGDWTMPNAIERWRVVALHIEAYRLWLGNNSRGVGHVRKHVMWYSNGLCGASAFRSKIKTATDFVMLQKRCRDYFLNAEIV